MCLSPQIHQSTTFKVSPLTPGTYALMGDPFSLPLPPVEVLDLSRLQAASILPHLPRTPPCNNQPLCALHSDSHGCGGYSSAMTYMPFCIDCPFSSV